MVLHNSKQFWSWGWGFSINSATDVKCPRSRMSAHFCGFSKRSFPWDHVIWMLQQTFLGSIHKSPLALIDSGLWLYVSSRVESEKCPVFTQLMSVSTYPPSTRCGNHRHQRPCSQCGLGDRQTSVCNPAWGPPWELQSMEEHHAQIGDREGQRGVPGREPWNWELEKSKG